MYPSFYGVDNRALRDFNRMLNRGTRHRLMNKIKGKRNHPLDFEVVRENMQLGNQHDIGIQVINIEAVVGSVGRTHDFDDEFHPVSDNSRERWCGVAIAFYSDKALPPVELYKIDEQYFIIDGNHRISIYKANGQQYIEANVIEIEPLTNRCQTQELPIPRFDR